MVVLEGLHLLRAREVHRMRRLAPLWMSMATVMSDPLHPRLFSCMEMAMEMMAKPTLALLQIMAMGLNPRPS